MPRKIQKLSILNNLESRLNEDTDNILEEFQELSRIAINGFDSEVEFKKYLSEGALLNVNKLVSNALSIPCGEYMVLVYASDNSVLVPTSEDTSIADAQPSIVNIHPNKLIGLWDKIERVIGEDDDFGHDQNHSVKQKKSKKDATTLADLFDSLPTDQASLAKEIGVAEPSISRWTAPAGDSSHRTPTVDHIKKIANATGVGVCSVLNMVSNNSSAGTKSRKGKGNSKSGSGGGAAWGGESIDREESISEDLLTDWFYYDDDKFKNMEPHGSQIPGSRFLRVYCKRCGCPGRSDSPEEWYCEECSPREIPRSRITPDDDTSPWENDRSRW